MSSNTLDDLELELRRLPGVRAAGFDERDDLLLVQLHVTSTGRGLPAQAARIVARSSNRPVAVEVVRWRDPGTPPVDPVDAIDAIDTNDTDEAIDPVDTIDTDEAIDPVDTIDPADTIDTDEAIATNDTDGTPISTGETDEIVLVDDAPIAPEEPRTGGGSTGERYRLLAVLSFPDTGEVEVHLIRNGRRTIGRAPAAGGLPAVVDATIGALEEPGSPLSPTTLWARPIEGTGEDSSLVAVALQSDGIVRYGLARGSSPLEATARSALHALNRRLAAVA